MLLMMFTMFIGNYLVGIGTHFKKCKCERTMTQTMGKLGESLRMTWEEDQNSCTNQNTRDKGIADDKDNTSIIEAESDNAEIKK